MVYHIIIAVVTRGVSPSHGVSSKRLPLFFSAVPIDSETTRKGRMSDIPDILETSRATATGKRKFPQMQDQGENVYDVENRVFRDNSRFVTDLVEKNNVLFTRPPQLGKTTLLSLAELLLSDTEKSPVGLESYPPPSVMNSWYVIRIDFGGVKSKRGKAPVEEWEERASEADKQIRVEVSAVVSNFLDQHQGLKEIFHSILKDCGMEMQELHAGQLISFLAGAIERTSRNRDDNTRPTLLLLVDEYDKPIREVVFDFIGEPKIPNIKEKMQGAFHHYVAFFDNIKQSNSKRVNVKAWVTGITPVGLTLISGFKYRDLTFRRTMADAIGLLESDVEKMVKEAIPNPSFDDSEQKEVFGTLREQFNNLRFPHGSPLFHTLLMNQAMAELQECTTRDEWLKSIEDIQAGEAICHLRAFSIKAVSQRASTSLCSFISGLCPSHTTATTKQNSSRRAKSTETNTS